MKYLAMIVAPAMVALLSGCSCQKDVTNDPDFNFVSIRNHVYVTKKEMLAYRVRDSTTGQMHVAISPAGATSEGSMPTAILPPGTLLRPVQLTGEFRESGDTVVYVRIESGLFAGSKATVWSDELFLDPSRSTTAGQTQVAEWKPNPVLLEPARE